MYRLQVYRSILVLRQPRQIKVHTWNSIHVPVPARQTSRRLSRHAVPSLSLVYNSKSKWRRSCFLSRNICIWMKSSRLIHEHLPSYDCLTTLLINLTMEGTLSEINSQFRRQVNKGVLRIVQRYLRDNAIAARRSTSCLCPHSSVHKTEIIRDETAS